MNEFKSQESNSSKTIPILVDFRNASWAYTFLFAMSWFILPLLIILSKLFGEKIGIEVKKKSG